MKTHIPADPEVAVCTQNTLNHAWLAHRKRYFSFPYLVKKVDYVILDLKRPLYLGEASASLEDFRQKTKEIEVGFQKVIEWDGFFIWRRKGLMPHLDDSEVHGDIISKIQGPLFLPSGG